MFRRLLLAVTHFSENQQAHKEGKERHNSHNTVYGSHIVCIYEIGPRALSRIVQNRTLAMDETFNNYQTMSITSLGPITLDQGQTNPFAAAKSTNFLDDIEGARTKSKHNQFTNKKPFLQSDVQGSTSKQLIRARNCRDNSLYIDDIDGTRHTIKDRMMRTNRHIDPLMPAYPLPSYAADSHVVPRFIKDPQRHDDIEGSSVKPTKVFAVKDTMSVSDIEGAQADWRPVHTWVSS